METTRLIFNVMIAGTVLSLLSFGAGYWYRNERAKEDKRREEAHQWHEEYWGTFWRNRSDLWWQSPAMLAPGHWDEKAIREQLNLDSKKARKEVELRKVIVHIDGRSSVRKP